MCAVIVASSSLRRNYQLYWLRSEQNLKPFKCLRSVLTTRPLTPLLSTKCVSAYFHTQRITERSADVKLFLELKFNIYEFLNTATHELCYFRSE